MPVTVVVDGENVRRSAWPNVSRGELFELATHWGEARGLEMLVVFDGAAPAGAIASGGESADDWIARWAGETSGPYWLVTSDRELRARAGARAERTFGGGAFLRELQGAR